MFAPFLTSSVLTAASLRGGPFDTPGQRAQAALVSMADQAAPPPSAPTSPMLLNLRGGLATLDLPQVNKLTDTARAGRECPVTPDFRRVGVVHLRDGAGKVLRRVELLVGPAGAIAARPVPDAEPASPPPAPQPPAPAPATLLDAEKFRQLSITWNRYRGPFGPGSPGLTGPAAAPPLGVGPPATVAPIDRPVPAPIYLDEKTFSDRFLSGGTARPLKPVRILSQERFYLRPPARYDPAHPVGLLIWVNAGPDGRPPEAFNKALDELGIAAVGPDNAGNDRPVVDRFQLALDALFAASERLHIDPRRVYITGISGGGRTCTRLACCFPDYITGAVPIVGLSAYFDTPLGNGKYSPAGFDRPSTARFNLLRTRRIGAVTGDKDINHDEMAAIVERFTRDRLQARLFDHENFGHQLPSPGQFTEALKWVDEPYQEAVNKERAAAQALLDAYIRKNGDAPPPPKDTRAAAELVKVTQTAPWSDPAWHAARLLTPP